MHKEKVLEFGQIVEMAPFNTDEKIATFADLDGVFVKYGKEHSNESNIVRLNGLRKVIERSDEFVFWSSRFRVDENSNFWKFASMLFEGKSISKFPFLTNKSIERLENFAKNSNPDCRVESKIGIKKMRSCFGIEDDFVSMALKTIQSEKKMVVIGSSIIDRNRVRNLAENIKRQGSDPRSLYYFDTGHFLY